MTKHNEKIVAAQTMAHDVVAEISAMLNQDNITREYLEKLKARMEEFSDMLDTIETQKVDF